MVKLQLFLEGAIFTPIFKMLVRALQTDVIIMDFAKAFDKVPHRRLLYNLDYYGIRGSTHTCSQVGHFMALWALLKSGGR